MKSQSYRDLMVWNKSIALCVHIYEQCANFPKSELYGITDQIKRASVSIPSNIAEGQARQGSKEFLHFLSIAAGSLAELDTQRIIAEPLHFLSRDKSSDLDHRITELQKMLYALIKSLKTANSQLKTKN
jgi:four helix bundle protein